MDEVKKYGVIPDMVYGHNKFGPVTRDTEPGYFVAEHDFDRVTAERDAALGREDALRKEAHEVKESMAYRGSLFGRVQAERDALQQRLTAADERADVMVTALSRIQFRCQSFVENDCAMAVESVEAVLAIADDALKPAEGRGDEDVNEG